MAELNDLILQTLQTIQDSQRDMRVEMNDHFTRLNGRLTVVETRVDGHDTTLSTVKGAVAAVSGLGTVIMFFHEKWDALLKLIGLGRG